MSILLLTLVGDLPKWTITKVKAMKATIREAVGTKSMLLMEGNLEQVEKTETLRGTGNRKK
jgi:hypothetical protein